jgi:hypothetical protein
MIPSGKKTLLWSRRPTDLDLLAILFDRRGHGCLARRFASFRKSGQYTTSIRRLSYKNTYIFQQVSKGPVRLFCSGLADACYKVFHLSQF